MTEHVGFVVVGAGVMGLSAAHALASDGSDVVVLDQYEVGNTSGSSHGASRVFRMFYDRTIYARMAQLAVPLWRELERLTGVELLTVVGSIQTTAGADHDRATLDELAIPYEVISEDEAERRFPDVRLPGPVLYQADSAVVAADRTLTALKRLLGPRVRERAHVRALRDTSDGVLVETADGTLRADVVIACCGSYAPELLSPLDIDVPMMPTLELVAYFRHRSGEMPRDVPVILDIPGWHYGLPTTQLGLYKFAEHGAGARIDPRRDTRDADADALERLLRVVPSMLPGFDAEPARVETCVYENTPDRDFVIDRRGRVVVGTGFSGHGFKFAPLVGRLLAELALGRPPSVDLSAFSLDRPTLRSNELAKPR